MFGTEKLIGVGVLLAVLGVGVISWHEKGVQEAKAICTLQWKAALQSANAETEQKLQQAQEKASVAQAELEARSKGFEEKVDSYVKALEAKREHIPLSDACNACRIPGDRLRALSTGDGNRDRNKDRQPQTN